MLSDVEVWWGIVFDIEKVNLKIKWWPIIATWIEVELETKMSPKKQGTKRDYEFGFLIEKSLCQVYLVWKLD